MNATASKRDILVSIRPPFADAIVAGRKTVELRRRFTDGAQPGSTVLIYSSSPTQAIVASAVISGISRLHLDTLWKRFGKAACVDRDFFYTYFSGLPNGYAIVLGNVRPFRRQVKASEMERRFGFVAPQSFMYLRQEHYRLLKHEHSKASDRHKRLHRSGGPQGG